jgi:hypothetical protein
MRPMNAYKDMLDNVLSPITCVSMNHQNQLEQMANGAMFATISPFWWLWQHKQSKYKFAKSEKIRATYICLDAYHHPNPP